MGSRINLYSVTLVKESAKIYDFKRDIRSPKDAYEVIEKVLQLSSKTNEHLVMMSLNIKNQVIGIHPVHVGTLNASVVHPRDIFQHALLNNAATFMIFHNHPSGNPEPSPEDIAVTKRMKDAGNLMGIELLDHIIIGDGEFISLNEKGYI